MPDNQTCERCPHKGAEHGCPAWISKDMGFAERNDQTGQLRMLEGCFYPMVLRFMYDVVKVVDGCAQSIQSNRNEMMKGMQQFARVLYGNAAPESMERYLGEQNNRKLSGPNNQTSEEHSGHDGDAGGPGKGDRGHEEDPC